MPLMADKENVSVTCFTLVSLMLFQLKQTTSLANEKDADGYGISGMYNLGAFDLGAGYVTQMTMVRVTSMTTKSTL